MANLQFNADNKSNLASYTTAGQVIFTEDNLYLVKNDGSKIKYSSIEVVSSLPSTNISDNKIYILNSSGTYTMNYYDGSAWVLLGGGSGLTQAQIDEIAKISSKQNSNDTNLSTPVQTIVGGINYINGELTTVKGDLANKIDAINAVTNGQFTSHTGNTNNPHQTKIINLADILLVSLLDGQTLIYDSASGKFVNGNAQSDGKLKMDSSSVADYLNNLIDGVTIQNINGKLVSKSIDGLTVDVATINYLQGLNSNIMTLIGNLTNPMTMLGVFDTHALLIANTSAVNGSTAIVKVDETNSNQQMMYLYVGTGTYNSANWTAVSQSNVEVRNFTTNPINLASEVTGVLPVGNIDISTLAKISDLINYLDKANYTGTGTTPVNVAKTLQGMVSTVAQVDNSVNASHVHSNKSYIDKLGEDITGEPTYNGKPIGSGVTTEDTMLISVYDSNKDGSVAMSDKLSSELTANNGTVYYKNNSGVVGWSNLPIPTPTNSSVNQLEFVGLTTNIPQTQDFNPLLTNIEGLVQCYELITALESTEIITDLTINQMTNKTSNINITTDGLKILDNFKINLYSIASPYNGYSMKESEIIDVNSYELLYNIQ